MGEFEIKVQEDKSQQLGFQVLKNMIIYVAIHSQIDVLIFFPKRREEVAKIKGVRLLQGVLMPQAFKVPMWLIQKTWTLLN